MSKDKIRNATVVLARGKIPRYEDEKSGKVIGAKTAAAWTLVPSHTDAEMTEHLGRSMLSIEMREYILNSLGFGEEWFESSPPHGESPEHDEALAEAERIAETILEQVEIKVTTEPYESFDKEGWVLRAAPLFERETGKTVEFNDGWKEE